jgi:GTPase SAR1 family protein
MRLRILSLFYRTHSHKDSPAAKTMRIKRDPHPTSHPPLTLTSPSTTTSERNPFHASMANTKDIKMPSVGLQTAEHEELLNLIDTLRSQGVSRYVDLPQLIVCGDQSSGKSSVLEAISGLRFPTKDNLCTRFATELILRRGPSPYVQVTIIPDADRTAEETATLSKFTSPSTSIDDFDTIVMAAEKAMGLDGAAKVFSKDVLRVELCGPQQPHLTLVDLPGIFYAGDRSQSDSDALLVQSLVKSYMEKSRSIILAVVSAKSDLAMQVVTKMAREIDPKGQRTLGIITKPDLLFSGSDSENAFVKLAKNENIEFRLGWHVLRNRDYDTRNATRAQRDAAEKEFFQKRVWSTALRKTQIGIEHLRPRLSRVLLAQVLAELPSFFRDVDRELECCKDRLAALGGPRGTLDEQRIYLLKASQTFTTLMKAAIEGTYTDAFFGTSETKEGYAKRLRAVVQYTMAEFAKKMAQEGHATHIYDDNDDYDPNTEFLPARKRGVQMVSRDKYLESVATRMRRNRGRELPGLFNPAIIGDLFFEQSKPWESILRQTQQQLIAATKSTINLVLKNAADAVVKDGIMRYIIGPNIEPIIEALNAKIEDVLRPHQRGHPLTFNHYFTENLQKKRQEEIRKATADKIRGFFNADPFSANGGQVYQRTFAAKSLLDALAPGTEQDMEKFGAIEAMNAMEAYYKVSLVDP